ncbi:MAG: twin-arginine translocase subunit TatB [Magnetococcales bacterium]|nr:twin-arginine translocase subunit TatB [Magnetococcales bacterium]
MFGIGIIEVFVVLMVALFVIGPEKIPEAARTVGRFFRTVRQYMNEIKRSVDEHNPLRDLQDQDEFDVPELIPSIDDGDDDVVKSKSKKKEA